MPAQSYATVWTAFLSPSTADVAVGYCMTLDAGGDYYVIATSANRTAASRTTAVAGITLTAGDSTNRAVELQTIGPCPPEVTGLGAGAAGYIIVNSVGRLERKTSPAASDIVAGKCDADGWAYLNFVARDGSVVVPIDVGTSPYPAGAPAAVGFNWGLPSDFSTGYLIRANYPSLYDAGEIGYQVISALDAGSGSASLTFGTYTPDAGEQLVTQVSGNAVNLVVGGVTALQIANSGVLGNTRWGAHLYSSGYRVGIGSNGSSSYPEFSSTNNSAGPMLMLVEAIAEPTGNPTGSSFDGVWIWLANPSTGGIKHKFPSGNICILPDVAGTLITDQSPALTTPWIADSTGGQFYKFVVSNLTADRNVTLPLLTGADTFVFEAQTQTLTNKNISAATAVTSSWFGGSGTLASAGLLRSANAVNVVVGRNAANSADCTLLGISSGNECFVGLDVAYGTRSETLRIYANSTVYMGVGAGTTLILMSSTVFAALSTNASFFDAAGSYGGGSGVVFHKNAATNPTSNPTAGGIMYADAGAGKWRGSGGTTTTFGPADPHCEKCGRDFAHQWENDHYDEALSVCMVCLLDALAGLGVPVDAFSKRRLSA